MTTMIDLCFLCTKDYNCVPVDSKIVSQVEYLLPEITIFELGIPLRICSVCDGALYAFSKFKQCYLESSRRLEANIKGAQGPLLPKDSSHIVDGTKHKQQNVSLTGQQIAQTSLHTDKTSKKDQEYNTENISKPECTKELFSAFNEFKEIYEKNSQEMGPRDPLLQTDNEPNLQKIEDVYIKEEQMDESSSDMDYFNSEVKDFVCNICNKSFTLKCHLVCHLKSHSVLQDYICEICNTSFIQKADLDHHMERHIGVNDLNYNSDEHIEPTSELHDETENLSSEMLPNKSRVRYERAYQVFVKWCEEKEIYDYTEDVLLDYFKELVAQNRKSLWAIYSMLKSCIMINKDIDISKYSKLSAYLKLKTLNHKPKRSKALKEEHINAFIDQAPDLDYLMMKVVLIIGLSGALRREELYNMELKDVELKNDIIIVSVPDIRNKSRRQFAIINNKWVTIVKKYLKVRSEAIKIKHRFFLKYQKGRCINSPVGINTMGSMPSKIANYLKLEDYREYTGHCFRRSSASLLANRGDLLTLKTYGGRKCPTVTEGYDELKRKMAVDLSEPEPSTSKKSNIETSTQFENNITDS